MKLDRITPFAVPVILEIGRETVFSGEAAEAILRESENSIAHEAMS
jgi:ATP-dependent Lhr-like helicase